MCGLCGDDVWGWWWWWRLSWSSLWDTLLSSLSTNWTKPRWSCLKLKSRNRTKEQKPTCNHIVWSNTVEISVLQLHRDSGGKWIQFIRTDCVVNTSAVADWPDLRSAGWHVSLCSASVPGYSKPPVEEPAYENQDHSDLWHKVYATWCVMESIIIIRNLAICNSIFLSRSAAIEDCGLVYVPYSTWGGNGI